ncbi:MAG: sulfite exporter TauE/SafE family protein [Myxococcales bacterium]|nr:sulfite exporter TauE/SafE family protein [Myxococcales bacterium]MCB9530239.1 sulfite exporter TauE/SafE family protein [Myxococcales bacterium]MCB9533752.1 sulfite exporter TauE/SafE family protein [Myxococcales bacterium]
MADPALTLTAAAFGVGFVGSLHCVGMCGPFAALAGQGSGWRGVATYSAGRTATYAALGAGAGLLGSTLAQLRTLGALVSIGIIVVVALQLAGILPEPRFASRVAGPLVRRLSARVRGFRFLLGAASALMPCGLVYAALGVAVTAGSPSMGALAMVAFGLATWPALLAVGVGAGRIASMGPRLRQGVAVVVAATGLWAVHHRGGMNMEAHTMVDVAADASEAEVPECCRGHVHAP